MAFRSSRLAKVVGVVVLMGALASCGAGGASSGKNVGVSSQGQDQVKVDIHAFEVQPNITTVHAGAISFDVTNSDVQKHEMLVVPFPEVSPAQGGVKTVAAVADTADAMFGRMAFDQATLRLNEDQLGSLGETGEVPAQTIGHVTLDLKPGTYLLLCNLPAHFRSGMYAKFTVLP